MWNTWIVKRPGTEIGVYLPSRKKYSKELTKWVECGGAAKLKFLGDPWLWEKSSVDQIRADLTQVFVDLREQVPSYPLWCVPYSEMEQVCSRYQNNTLSLTSLYGPYLDLITTEERGGDSVMRDLFAKRLEVGEADLRLRGKDRCIRVNDVSVFAVAGMLLSLMVVAEDLRQLGFSKENIHLWKSVVDVCEALEQRCDIERRDTEHRGVDDLSHEDWDPMEHRFCSVIHDANFEWEDMRLGQVFEWLENNAVPFLEKERDARDDWDGLGERLSSFLRRWAEAIVMPLSCFPRHRMELLLCEPFSFPSSLGCRVTLGDVMGVYDTLYVESRSCLEALNDVVSNKGFLDDRVFWEEPRTAAFLYCVDEVMLYVNAFTILQLVQEVPRRTSCGVSCGVSILRQWVFELFSTIERLLIERTGSADGDDRLSRRLLSTLRVGTGKMLDDAHNYNSQQK